MQPLELRRAILEVCKAYQEEGHPTPIKDDELAARLRVSHERLEAHFVFLERARYISFLRMPGPDGSRLRFVEITEEGKHYLATSQPVETKAALESPFKVVQGGQDKIITDFPQLRSMVEQTEWVIDEEKPEILGKLDQLEKVLEDDRFNPAAVSELKLYFERHRWLSSHIAATVKKRFGF